MTSNLLKILACFHKIMFLIFTIVVKVCMTVKKRLDSMSTKDEFCLEKVEKHCMQA